MTPVEMQAKARALRTRSRKLREEASGIDREAESLELAAQHAIDPHCANCGHCLSEHEDDDDDEVESARTAEEKQRRCRYFDLNGDCFCDGYVKSDVPRHACRDTRR